MGVSQGVAQTWPPTLTAPAPPQAPQARQARQASTTTALWTTAMATVWTPSSSKLYSRLLYFQVPEKYTKIAQTTGLEYAGLEYAGLEYAGLEYAVYTGCTLDNSISGLCCNEFPYFPILSFSQTPNLTVAPLSL